MKELIEALNIFLKYDDKTRPFACEHDTLYVNYEAEKMKPEDVKRLDELGFFVDDETGTFMSFRYGSC